MYVSKLEFVLLKLKTKVLATIAIYVVVRNNFKESRKLTKQSKIINAMERKIAVKISLMVVAFSVTTR